MEAICRKTLQRVKRDSGATPYPENFGKKLYVSQNRGGSSDLVGLWWLAEVLAEQ